MSQIYLRDLVDESYIDGQKLSYREYLDLITTDRLEFINPETDLIMNHSMSADIFWGDVQDYTSAVVEQILLELIQENQDGYIKLMAVIKSTYDKLKARKPTEAQPRRHLRLIK